jgi:UDP-glucose 4-epimerase
MDHRAGFGGSPPSPSFSAAHSSSSDVVAGESVGTPGTHKSLLFDHVPPLNISHDDETYIMVVGGLGYIGSHTTLELLKAGYNVIAVDDLSNSYRDVLSRVEYLSAEFARENRKPKPTLKFHEADYKSPAMRSIVASYQAPAHQSPDSIQASRIKGVIHFAAFKAVEESISKPIAYYQNNVCGMVNFLTLLDEFGIKNFVFSSSATVYGSKANKGTQLREELCVHDVETYVDKDGVQQVQEPGVMGLTSPYGRTKWMCEAILADVAKADPTWTITALRYFNPVGCHESGLLGDDPRQKPSNLVPVVIRVLTGQQEKLSIFGNDWDTPDGTTIRDYIHVSDLARGHIAAVAAAGKGSIKHSFRAYNIGTGQGHTVREIVAALRKASGKEIPYEEVGRRPGDVGYCVAGVDRTTEELHWKTEKTLDECARDVWNFTVMSKQKQDIPKSKEDGSRPGSTFSGRMRSDPVDTKTYP